MLDSWDCHTTDSVCPFPPWRPGLWTQFSDPKNRMKWVTVKQQAPESSFWARGYTDSMRDVWVPPLCTRRILHRDPSNASHQMLDVNGLNFRQMSPYTAVSGGKPLQGNPTGIQLETSLLAARAASLVWGSSSLNCPPCAQVTSPPLTIRQGLEAHLAAELAIASHGAGTHLYHIHHARPQAVNPRCVGLAPGHGGVELIMFLKKGNGRGQWPAPAALAPDHSTLEYSGSISSWSCRSARSCYQPQDIRLNGDRLAWTEGIQNCLWTMEWLQTKENKQTLSSQGLGGGLMVIFYCSPLQAFKVE